ncbi:MAG TPA: hypothetical protein VE263_16750 [Candidatus Angelobacter sp.]|nr:hypothetical protein [Candidatus Angelobacter sp.]
MIGGLIVVEILLGLLALREGRQQAAILDRMNKNTADTAAQIQRAADATTASLEILRQERAERAKKPRLALFIGNTPLDRASIRLQAPAGLAQDAASFDLLVRNIGDAPVSTFRLHVLTPKGVGLDAEQLIIVPQIGPPTHPNTQVVTLQLPLLPAAETYRLQITVYAPKGHPAFKITFTVDAMELRAVAPLGSLTVLPLKP